MRQVHCIGEILIDFISNNRVSKLEDVESFSKKAGGAPANVAIAISKLGGNSQFLGQIGVDPFGNFLKNTLEENKVGTTSVDFKGNTTLAFVTLDKNGERGFHFFRGCDGEYKLSSIEQKIKENDIVHFGSATAFISGELKKSYEKLLKYCVENNILISFDPNYRDTLIDEKNLTMFKQKCWEFMKKADLIKISEDEALLLTGKGNINDAIEFLVMSNLKTVLITRGKDGTILLHNMQVVKVDTIEIKQKDSTGAGDAFIGALLYLLSKKVYKNLSTLEMKEFVEFANIVGGITATGYGAIESLPTMDEVNKVIGENNEEQ